MYISWPVCIFVVYFHICDQILSHRPNYVGGFTFVEIFTFDSLTPMPALVPFPQDQGCLQLC